MNPFTNIFKLSLWDFGAKTAYFLAFIYLARVLGVSSYGVLEFAISVLTYFLLIAEGGLEVWATREAAKTEDIPQLVSRIIPLRFLFSGVAFLLLIALLPLLPPYPFLKLILILFGLSLFVQAGNLKWVFMGKENMGMVGRGLALAQLVFAIGVFAFIRNPLEVYWVPVMKLFGDLIMAGYFARRFTLGFGELNLRYRLEVRREVVGPALMMGTSQGLGLLNYNFDTLLLGLITGPMAVGLYNAAYRPVTMALAMPLTYFIGLFPILSRLHKEGLEGFTELVKRSLGLSSMVAFPLGVSGLFLSEPIVMLLFGQDYRESVPALQVLVWSAVLVILRGTYRQALNAAGCQNLDLRCAATSATLNVTLNVILIPRLGFIGAAIATVIGDFVWLLMASIYFNRHVTKDGILKLVMKPFVASLVMSLSFLCLTAYHWMLQASVSGVIYCITLLFLGKSELRTWFFLR